MPAPDRSRRFAWLLGVPLLLAVAVYARVLRGEFMFDDSRAIERNLAVKDLARFLRADFFSELLHGGRPVADLTFAVDYAVGGLDPRPFHASGIAVHLVAIALVFFFTRAVLRLAGAARADAVALAVAGLFALHPLQTQAVSYLVQRAETLASACYLGALLLLLRLERRGWSRAGAAAYAGAILVFAVGLGSKAIVATLPVAWLLLAWIVPDAEQRRRILPWRTRLALAAPVVALDLWSSTRTVAQLEGHVDAGFSVPGMTPWTYLLSQARVIVTYLRLLLWPSGQNVDWDFPVAKSLAEPTVLASGLLLLALLGGALWLGTRARRQAGPGAAASRVAAFGVLWFFLVLAPTSSLVPLADLVMEHRVYLACWGLLVAAAVGAERLASRIPGRRAGLVAAAAVAVLWAAAGAATFVRNAAWETRLALWSDAAAKSPRKARVHLGLGFSLRDRGRYAQAVQEYAVALAWVGQNVDLELQILCNLGSALIYMRRLEDAENVLRKAVGIEPRALCALINLSVIAQRRDDMAGVELWARQVVALEPEQGDALHLLGLAALRRGDIPGAIALLERSARADPDEGVRLLNLGLAYEMAGRTADACAAWRRALGCRLDPSQRERTLGRLAAPACGGGR